MEYWLPLWKNRRSERQLLELLVPECSRFIEQFEPDQDA